MPNLDLNQFISRLKSIISLARRFGTHTGLKVSFADLERIVSHSRTQGRLNEADELDLIIEFLKQEQEDQDLKRKKVADLTSQMSLEVPVGRLVTFRHKGLGNLVGSVVGFLADRVIIKVGDFGERSDIYEVSPLDIKL